LFFSLSEGELLVIVGHNGAGKTTLFRCLTGTLDFKGEIKWKNKPLKDFGDQPIAFLPQQNPIQFPITVLEIIRIGISSNKNRWFGYSEEENLAAAKLGSAFGLGHKLDSDMAELSGGQQQLAWLAQLAARNAPIWILDEPTQGLDIYHKNLIMNYLNNEVKQNQRTILISTHDLDLLEGSTGQLLNLSEIEPKPKKLSSQVLEEAKNRLKEAPVTRV
jgi:iron complex transport system ATP-binding protein